MEYYGKANQCLRVSIDQMHKLFVQRSDRQFGYVPFAVLDVSSTGRQTREGSRTLEVSPIAD